MTQNPLQSRIVGVLAAAQVLGGIGIGATLSVGALLAAEVSGSEAWSGMAATMTTLGAAILAIPLARLAARHGRRFSLGTGAFLAAIAAVLLIVAASLSWFPLLLVAFALVGAGSAVNLQARFAATDLASPKHRGRDLSLVVWSTTIGSVLGPNLIEPGEQLGSALGLPPLTGPFVFTLVAQLAATVVYFIGLRPAPHSASNPSATAATKPVSATAMNTLRATPLARFAIGAIALSHATMVAVMAMTPVHLSGHGASLAIVGFTISLHIAGMYALAPVFGWLADRWGRLPMLAVGQAILLGSLLTVWLGSESHTAVVFALVLLGVGWSASTIAGSALLVDSLPTTARPAVQGVSDLCMNLMGAAGGALAGLVLAGFGYSGLGVACMLLVAAVVAWMFVAVPTIGSTTRITEVGTPDAG